MSEEMQNATPPVQAQAPVQTPAPVVTDNSGKATASMVLGIIGLVAWFIPLFGLPITIVGLVMGVKSLGSAKRTRAIVGITLSIIGLVLTIINFSVGAYMGATGQHPIVNEVIK